MNGQESNDLENSFFSDGGYSEDGNTGKDDSRLPEEPNEAFPGETAEEEYEPEDPDARRRVPGGSRPNRKENPFFRGINMEGDLKEDDFGFHPGYSNQFPPQSPEVEGDDDTISQEDCWTIITAFFSEKGLVRQQLDSFDEFISNTIQTIIDQTPALILQTSHVNDHRDIDKMKQFKIKFEQISLMNPANLEADGSSMDIDPQIARMRNLTYAAPLFVNSKNCEHD